MHLLVDLRWVRVRVRVVVREGGVDVGMCECCVCDLCVTGQHWTVSGRVSYMGNDGPAFGLGLG